MRLGQIWCVVLCCPSTPNAARLANLSTDRAARGCAWTGNMSRPSSPPATNCSTPSTRSFFSDCAGNLVKRPSALEALLFREHCVKVKQEETLLFPGFLSFQLEPCRRGRTVAPERPTCHRSPSPRCPLPLSTRAPRPTRRVDDTPSAYTSAASHSFLLSFF